MARTSNVETTSSAAVVSERTPRTLRDGVLQFGLENEVRALCAEDAWAERGHNARTLIKYDDLRSVLIVLAAGARMHEHTPDETVWLHALVGRVRVTFVDREPRELGPGELLAVERSIMREIEALDDSALLLTLGWSLDREV